MGYYIIESISRWRSNVYDELQKKQQHKKTIRKVKNLVFVVNLKNIASDNN